MLSIPWWHFSCVYSRIEVKIKSKYSLDHLFLNLICRTLHIFLGIVSFSHSLSLLKPFSLLQWFVMRVWRVFLILECILNRPFSYPKVALNQASNFTRWICTWGMSQSQAQTLAGLELTEPVQSTMVQGEHRYSSVLLFLLADPCSMLISSIMCLWHSSSAVCTPDRLGSAEQHFKAMRDHQEHSG